jgi:hypothetical protein
MARQESSAFSAVLGDPIPILSTLILAGKSTKTRTNWYWFPSKLIFVCRRPCALLGAGRLVTAVLQHLDFLERDEAAIHHSVEHGQEFIDLLFGIHDFDHQGQIQ